MKDHQIEFAITGGLAAKSYGSPRPLNDIDIDIHDHDFDKILDAVKPFVTFGPAHYQDERWDLRLMTLCHEGQEIDISGADNLKICDARTGQWQKSQTDFSQAKPREVFEILAPVVAKNELITYKSMLLGDHQKIDIQTVKNS